MKSFTLKGSKSKFNTLANKTAYIASCSYYTSKKVAAASKVIIKQDYDQMKSNLKHIK